MTKDLLALGILAAIVLFAWGVETLLDRRQTLASRLWLGLIVAGLVALILALTAHFARARDLGQWEATDPQIREWYQHLMQPDAPTASCCGEADAYWADSFHASPDGKSYVAIITDDRPDEPLRRPHMDVGTEVVVPDNKIKWDRGNPTGHGVIFISRVGYVFCYVPPGGV
jgi:hypothetical protein